MQYLTKKQWMIPQQGITGAQLATILLSTVISHGQRNAADKISENTTNIIKAVAFLIEENMAPITSTQDSDEMSKLIKESFENLNKSMQVQTERLQKATKKLQEIQDSSAQVSPQMHTNANLSYRDALTSGSAYRLFAQPPLVNDREANIQNRLNIEGRQILIEIQSQDEETPCISDPMDLDSIGKIKVATNAWLANRNGENPPPPPDSSIKGITKYRKNRLLIEANNRETADWLKANATHGLQPIIGHQIKVLSRLYPVTARFMPIRFQTDELSTRELEISANLPADSISHVQWIRNPERRPPGQQYANVRIYCKSAENANAMILDSGHIQHLNSQLRIHKDIKTHSTCNRCQKYGHIAQDCAETTSTCAKCGGAHRTGESNDKKCTPCGSSEHHTNQEQCPERIKRCAKMDRRPNEFSPYYITQERWTWGLYDNETPRPPQNIPGTQQGHGSDAANPNQKHIPNRAKRHPAKQSKPTDRRFHQGRTQTGANTTPLGDRAKNTANPDAPTQHRKIFGRLDCLSSTSTTVKLTVNP